MCHSADDGGAKDRIPGRVIIGAALDNLTKGASGQAVQNMNAMLGPADQPGGPDLVGARMKTGSPRHARLDITSSRREISDSPTEPLAANIGSYFRASMRLRPCLQVKRWSSAVINVAPWQIAVATINRSAGSPGRFPRSTARSAMSPVKGNSTIPPCRICSRISAAESSDLNRPLAINSANSQKLIALIAS